LPCFKKLGVYLIFDIIKKQHPYEGTVKFYSQEKGFGFIGSKSLKLSGDTWFHITAVIGENPPKVGEKVTFSVLEEMRKGKHVAIEVSIRHEPLKQKNTPSLGGFPCIRGSSVGGFIINRDIGLIETSSSYDTQLKAENALILLAKSKGANAIFYYRWTIVHDTVSLFFSDPPTYSAKGNAVLLVPIVR